MAKPKTPNQKSLYKALNNRLNRYASLVQSVYDLLNQQAANLVGLTGYDGVREFAFSDYPQIREAVKRLQLDYIQSMQSIIYRGTSDEWKNSNLIQDLLAKKSMAFYESNAGKKKHKVYYQTNDNALKAFQTRVEHGMNLSQKLWDQSVNYKEELEKAISTSIERGMSAATLSKKLSKYLRDFDTLKTDYKEKYGKAIDIHDCEYRSMRLARSEINIAYRSAEQIRWQQMDFVLGKEIKLSKGHKERDYDICDELVGRYPKDFDWKGRHPNCYLPNALVLTDNGWKFIKDVSESDKVLSLNPYNRNIEYVGIIAKQAFPYQGEIVRFRNRSLDCAVTADHRMVYLNKSDKRIRYKSALEFNKNMGAFYRGCEYYAEDIKDIDANGKSIPFDLFCEFMGYWLADGSIMHNNQVVISQKKGEPAYESILRCISDLGCNPYLYQNTIVFNDRELHSYLKQFGTCKNKYISHEIIGSSKRQISIFLDAFVKCNGYTRNPITFAGSHGNVFESINLERIFFTVSESIYAGLCELLLKVGKRPSITKKSPITTVKKDGTLIKGNYEMYIIRECNAVTATFFTKTQEKYSGIVYDLTLDRNHIMYIQQNGKCYWGSNCLCYTIPIVMSEEDFWSDNRENSPNIVTEPPENFSKWCSANSSRILNAEKKGTLPYFVKDNKEVVYNSDVELYARRYFSVEEIQQFKESLTINSNFKSVDIASVFEKKGFTEDEVKEFQSFIDFHRYGDGNQYFNDATIALEMWNENSRMGSLLRLNADIEETAYKLYRKNNPPLNIYRAGTMERDTLSFTKSQMGVEQIIEGKSYRWSPDIVTTVDEILKEHRLFGGIVNKDIGYGGEEELFFVRKKRKYLDMDWYNKEVEKEKQHREKEALELKGDKLKEYQSLSSEYMNLFFQNVSKIPEQKFSYFTEMGKNADNSAKGLEALKRAYKELKSLLGL